MHINAATYISLREKFPEYVVILQCEEGNLHTYCEDAILISGFLDLPVGEEDIIPELVIPASRSEKSVERIKKNFRTLIYTPERFTSIN